jgi:hypothetical protein
MTENLPQLTMNEITVRKSTTTTNGRSNFSIATILGMRACQPTADSPASPTVARSPPPPSAEATQDLSSALDSLETALSWACLLPPAVTAAAISVTASPPPELPCGTAAAPPFLPPPFTFSSEELATFRCGEQWGGHHKDIQPWNNDDRGEDDDDDDDDDNDDEDCGQYGRQQADKDGHGPLQRSTGWPSDDVIRPVDSPVAGPMTASDPGRQPPRPPPPPLVYRQAFSPPLPRNQVSAALRLMLYNSRQ